MLTEQTDFSQYMAIMETQNAQTEDTLFYDLDQTREARPPDYPQDNTTTPNASVAKLNGNDPNKRIGPSIILKVMAGDTIQAAVRAFYRQQAAPQNNAGLPAEQMLAGLLQALVAPATQAASMHDIGLIPPDQTAGPGVTANDLQNLKQKDPDNLKDDKPKAYLNYVFFDKQFKFVDDGSGVKQVNGEPNQLETLSSGKMVAKKNGYVYVYTSNESKQDVLFDNLGVLDITGPVLEETHYYPFGLTMAGISSRALNNVPENKLKWNKGSELQNKEFSDGSGLELYETFYRSLDPQIGRFWQIDPKPNYSESPYVSMGNNPISFNDPLGDTLLTKADHRRAARIQKQINKTNASLNKNIAKWNGQMAAAQAKGNTNKVNPLQGKVNNANARITANTNTLNNLSTISNDQTQAYTFNQLPTGSSEGGTVLKTMNVNGSNQSVVVMNVLSDANAVHELTHAYQGAIQHMFSFNLDNAANPVTFLGASIFAAQMVNANSEIGAYQAQYGFSPGSMPSSSAGGVPGSMNNINAFYVGGLNGTNASGNAVPVYPNIQNMVNTIFTLLRAAF